MYNKKGEEEIDQQAINKYENSKGYKQVVSLMGRDIEDFLNDIDRVNGDIEKEYQSLFERNQEIETLIKES